MLRDRLWIERSCGSPIETRGVVASWDARAGALTAWISTQAPLPIKNGLARIFGLPEFKVDVIAPDVGGAFGSKIMLFYPEEILVPCAAMRLGRPVKWIEDRVEHLASTSQERGQRHEVAVAVDAIGRIEALSVRFLHDAGAYTPYGLIVPLITSTQLPGPYRIRNYHVEFRPPAAEGRCDACGGALVQRRDDTPAVVSERLAVYHRQIAPLRDYYRRRDLLTTIDGDRPAELVTKDLLAALSSPAAKGG